MKLKITIHEGEEYYVTSNLEHEDVNLDLNEVNERLARQVAKYAELMELIKKDVETVLNSQQRYKAV